MITLYLIVTETAEKMSKNYNINCNCTPSWFCRQYGCAHFEFVLPRKCRPVCSPNGHVSTKVANLHNFAGTIFF